MDSFLKELQKTLLEGVYDGDQCPLSTLRGCPHILKTIWREVETFWRTAIILPYERPEGNGRDVEDDFTTVKRGKGERRFRVSPYVCPKEKQDSFHSWLYFANIHYQTDFSFPEPTNIQINMMPFLVGETFESCKLPEFTRPYWSLIRACFMPEFDRESWPYWPREIRGTDVGKVYYLTIDESWVEAGSSQRRPGLHIDSPGDVKVRSGRGAGHTYYGHAWGRGGAHLTGMDPGAEFSFDRENRTILYGGIYLASNMANTTRVWNCGVEPEVVRRLGDIEYLRAGLPGPGEILQPNKLYWITDRTPHESLPLPQSGYRQFFRLVTSEVSLWYRDHSTPNPLGVQPDPAITTTVAGDKFSPEGVEVVVS